MIGGGLVAGHPDQLALPPARQVALDVQQAGVLHLPLIVLVGSSAPDPVPDEPVGVGGGLLQARLAFVLLPQFHLRVTSVPLHLKKGLHLYANLFLVLLLRPHLIVLLLLLVLGTGRLVPLLAR